MRAHADELEPVAAVGGGAVAVEGVAGAGEREAVAAVPLRDRPLERVALGVRDEPVEPVVGDPHGRDAGEGRVALGAHPGLEPLDAARADQRQRAVDDEHADALAVAGDRPAAEVERDGPAAVDDEAVARAARRGDRVGRVEPVGPDEQVAARARDRAAVDVVAAAAERAGRPGRQHHTEERQ